MSAERGRSRRTSPQPRNPAIRPARGNPQRLLRPAGFPDAVAKRIEAALEEAIEDPAVVQKTN